MIDEPREDNGDVDGKTPQVAGAEATPDDQQEDQHSIIRKKLTQIQVRTVDIPSIKSKVESTHEPKESAQKDQKRKRKYTSPPHSGEPTPKRDTNSVEGAVHTTAQNVAAVKNLVEDITEDLDHVQNSSYNLEELVKEMNERMMDRFDHVMEFRVTMVQSMDEWKNGHQVLARQLDALRQQQATAAEEQAEVLTSIFEKSFMPSSTEVITDLSDLKMFPTALADLLLFIASDVTFSALLPSEFQAEFARSVYIVIGAPKDITAIAEMYGLSSTVLRSHLIEMAYLAPCLWDTSQTSYARNYRKDMAWKRIANDMRERTYERSYTQL
ncbi:hypothetical protein OSTOST_01316 [Ostertagia ostertagi]